MYVEFFSETKSNLKGAKISQSQVSSPAIKLEGISKNTHI